MIVINNMWIRKLPIVLALVLLPGCSILDGSASSLNNSARSACEVKSEQELILIDTPCPGSKTTKRLSFAGKVDSQEVRSLTVSIYNGTQLINSVELTLRNTVGTTLYKTYLQEVILDTAAERYFLFGYDEDGNQSDMIEVNLLI